ncbi:hypothetical protein GGP73_003275 [Salinibacter ruber]|nr:hypothetical protein [Salinibacter ruber]
MGLWLINVEEVNRAPSIRPEEMGKLCGGAVSKRDQFKGRPDRLNRRVVRGEIYRGQFIEDREAEGRK